MTTQGPLKDQILYNVKHCSCGGLKGFKLELKPSNLVIPVAHLVDFPNGKRFNISEGAYNAIGKTSYANEKDRTIIATCLSCDKVYELVSTALTPIGDIQLRSSIGFSRVDASRLNF